MGRFEKGNVQAEQGRHQNIRTENPLQYALKIERNDKKQTKGLKQKATFVSKLRN